MDRIKKIKAARVGEAHEGEEPKASIEPEIESQVGSQEEANSTSEIESVSDGIDDDDEGLDLDDKEMLKAFDNIFIYLGAFFPGKVPLTTADEVINMKQTALVMMSASIRFAFDISRKHLIYSSFFFVYFFILRESAVIFIVINLLNSILCGAITKHYV